MALAHSGKCGNWGKSTNAAAKTTSKLSRAERGRVCKAVSNGGKGMGMGMGTLAHQGWRTSASTGVPKSGRASQASTWGGNSPALPSLRNKSSSLRRVTASFSA